MGDPLGPPARGKPSPFTNNYGTAETALALLSDYRRRSGRGDLSLGERDPRMLPPSVRVWVQNNSGANREMFDVLAINGIVGGIGDSDGGPDFVRQPAFTGTTPTATTDAFCVLEEPAPYVAGGQSPLVRAVIQGIVVVDVNVTDSGHGYATPTASDATKLTSATSGPARILYKPGGTGTLRCAVRLDESGGGSFSSGTTTYGGTYTITTGGVWEDTGFDLALPSAGTYLVILRYEGQVLTTNLGAASTAPVYSRLWNETAGSVIVNSVVLAASAGEINVPIRVTVTQHQIITVSAASTIRIEGWRSAVSTYTVSDIEGINDGTGEDGIVMSYLKIG